MAKVDFYVLPRTDEQARFDFACKLAEKAWRLNNSIFIETMSRADAERMDELLWTFRDGSFVPHEIAGSGDGAPVLIGFESSNVESRDLLISLCDSVPAIAKGFARVAELVTSDDHGRQQGRQRFSVYRDQGLEIDTHTL
ncbi:MAG: DNA polymerase III subunit chi [Pseudomonadota bacterium]